MAVVKIIAVLMIVAGMWGLIYGGFDYMSQAHQIRSGLFELSFRAIRTVNIPAWGGIASLMAGGLLLFASKRS